MSETLRELVIRGKKLTGVLTDEEVAARLDIPLKYLRDLMADSANSEEITTYPSPELIAKMVNILKVSKNEVLSAVGYSSQVGILPEKPKEV